MKLKLSKRWYEARSKAEEDCLDVAAGMSLSRITKKAAARKAKKSSAARRTTRGRTASVKRRAK